MLADDPVLEVERLGVSIGAPGAAAATLLRDVSFAVPRGRTLALVGESGSGKTLTAHAILRLLQAPARIAGGRIRLRPARGGAVAISELDERSELLYEVRGGMVGMVFQEPMSALSPAHTAGSQVAEAIWTHRRITHREARRRAEAMLAEVGLPPGAYDRYPHELSGGMRQRVLIAMALVCHPELLIADEPTTALDPTLQRQTLALLRRLQDEVGCSILLITHDFGVVAEAADEVAVLDRGTVVERGDVYSVLGDPRHPATQALVRDWAGRHVGRDRPAVRRAEAAGPPLLSVRGVSKRFGANPALHPVSFDLARGETLGIVGESGAGKTTLARCLLRALDPTSGQVLLRLPDGRRVDLARLRQRELKAVRPHAQMVFQDPSAALNPRMRVRELIAEPLIIHRLAAGSELEDRVDAVLARVGLSPDHRLRYPNAFSGGQRQRIVIARALILQPALLICDEATSGLDPAVQGQILDLLRTLQEETGLAYLFIAHHLGVIREFCDRVAVMRAGRIVEMAATEQLFSAPEHPYTRLLLSSAPSLEPRAPIPFPRFGDETKNGAKKPA